MSIFFPGHLSEAEIILDTVSRLLEPIRQLHPGAVQDALTAMQSGQSIEQAGKVIQIAIQSTLDQIQQDSGERQQALRKTIDELTNLQAVQEQELKELRSANDKLCREINILTKEVEKHQETIVIQNRILARQQHKLAKLLASPEEE